MSYPSLPYQLMTQTIAINQDQQLQSTLQVHTVLPAIHTTQNQSHYTSNCNTANTNTNTAVQSPSAPQTHNVCNTPSTARHYNFSDRTMRTLPWKTGHVQVLIDEQWIDADILSQTDDAITVSFERLTMNLGKSTYQHRIRYRTEPARTPHTTSNEMAFQLQTKKRTYSQMCHESIATQNTRERHQAAKKKQKLCSIELTECRRALQQKETEMKFLEARTAKFKTQISFMQNKLEVCNREHVHRLSKLDELRKMVEIMTTELKVAHQANKEQKVQITRLSEKLYDEENKTLAENVRLKQEVESMSRKCEAMQRRLTEMNAKKQSEIDEAVKQSEKHWQDKLQEHRANNIKMNVDLAIDRDELAEEVKRLKEKMRAREHSKKRMKKYKDEKHRSQRHRPRSHEKKYNLHSEDCSKSTILRKFE